MYNKYFFTVTMLKGRTEIYADVLQGIKLITTLGKYSMYNRKFMVLKLYLKILRLYSEKFQQKLMYQHMYAAVHLPFAHVTYKLYAL